MSKIKVHNIVRFEIGATPTDFKGVMSLAADINKGRFIPNFDEGDPYPHVSGSFAGDNVGTQDAMPVSGTLTLEDVAQAMTLLTHAIADATCIGKASGSAQNQKLDFSNLFFHTLNMRFGRGIDSVIALQFACYSDDGTTLPFARSGTADATAPSSSKIKTNNIVSVVHDSAPTPGVRDISFSVTRGIPRPDQDEGTLYPTGVDFIGLPAGQFPVTGQIGMENFEAADAFIADGMEDLVVTLKAAAGASNPVITAQNVQFMSARSQLQRRQDGSVGINFFAACDVGAASTLPLAIA